MFSSSVFRVSAAQRSQLRDLHDNDNQSVMDRVRAARALEEWASDRGRDAGFADLAFRASAQAQQARQAARAASF